MYAPSTIEVYGLDLNEKKVRVYFCDNFKINAELFGFVINPWFPYMVITVIFFALMVEPLGLKWLEHHI